MSDLEQFKLEVAKDYSATDQLREAAREDMRFINVPGGMWEDWLPEAYGENSPRAKMEFDIVSDPVYRFYGEYTLNRSNATFSPSDEVTRDSDAALMNKVYRADFRDNDGQVAQDLAVLEMAQCGVGAFKLSTKFEDDGDPENEAQDVFWEPLFNAHNQVIWDANAKRADKSDAKRCTLLTGFTKDAFEEEFPDAQPVSAYTPVKESGFDWNTKDEIYVAERYDVKKEKRTVVVYENIELNKVESYDKKDVALIEDELFELGWKKVRERKLTRQFVEKTVFSGMEILEETKKIAGEWIPVIPVYGYRTYIDGKEYSRGITRKLKDTNRLINMSVSRMAEAAATSPESVPVFHPDQVEGLTDLWKNRTNKAYLLKRGILNKDGEELHLPTEYVQPNQLDPNTMAVTEFASNFAQQSSGSVPLDGVDADSSGIAVRELRKVENLNTQVLNDNIDKSVQHSGRVYRSIQAEIQTEVRAKRALDEDGSTSLVNLNQSVFDRELGREVIVNDLSKGKFAVTVKASTQYETQKEATVDSFKQILEMIGPENEFFKPALAMLLKNVDGTGIEEFQDFVRQVSLREGFVKPETEEEQQFVQQLAQQEDPNKGLIEAATKQQNAEAINLEASSIQKIADAQKKKAEAVEITQNTKDAFIERRLALLAG